MPSARESFQQRPPDIGYTQTAYNTFSRPQEPAYYRGRGGINRGAPRGGRCAQTFITFELNLEFRSYD